MNTTKHTHTHNKQTPKHPNTQINKQTQKKNKETSKDAHRKDEVLLQSKYFAAEMQLSLLQHGIVRNIINHVDALLQDKLWIAKK